MPPLDGILVLDFSTLLPGPMATLMLAEAGATVVKIEPPSGEAMRAYLPKWGEDSAVFALLNRGKESLAVDLKDPAMRSRVLEMARRADVVVEQFRPGVMERLGLGYADLSAVNPKLIYCSITGYGQTGPRAAEAGHDLNYIGDAGFLALSMGDVDDAVLPPTPVADIGGGSYPAVINILLALEERRRTGRGRHIDIAMSENLFPFAYWALANGLANGRWPENGAHLVTGASSRYRVYATRDRIGLIVAALEPKFWTTFCDVIGLPDRLRDDSLDPSATMREVARIIGSHDAAAWSERLAGKDCCCSLMKDMADAVRDPHFVERGVFSTRLRNDRGEEIPALPVAIDRGFRAGPGGTLHAPSLGSANAGLAGEAAP
jgi:alpha-methylacyl-CoA racemase